MDSLEIRSNPPVHGGRLNAAVQRMGIPRERWLDLSTGINPLPWPVPTLPVGIWQRLPEDDDGLCEAIRHWSGAADTSAIVAVPGSQAAIQLLPRLREPAHVGIAAPGYSEHALWWRAAGHQVFEIPIPSIEQQLNELDVLVCINPNNPTGERFDPSVLLAWRQRLATRRGWLVVDEAFIDGDERASLVAQTGTEGLVVLRSLGKFFGLAGLRAGCVFAPPDIGERLSSVLGPWALSHPARYIMQQALRDRAWQETTRQRLRKDSQRLHDLLQQNGLPPSGGSLLFQYCPHEQAAALAAKLEREALLVRLFEQPPALRFGLPGAEAEWQQLEKALKSAVGARPSGR